MDQAKDEQPVITTTKPRNPFIAFLLSLLLPGLGQVYNGQPKKGIIIFSLLLLFPVLFGLTRGTIFFYGMLSLLVIEIALRIYTIIDGVKNAKQQKQYILKPYNTWYYHLLIAIAMLMIFNIYNISTVLGTQTFKVSTTSNNPTFQVGDWLLADMRAYKNNEPNYGDIVVYSRPDGEIYTSRVVGRPNDNIALINNIVSINGKASKVTFIKEANSDGIPVVELEEELSNGHKHLIYKFKQPYDSTKSNIKNIVVPPDNYYLLGDNRDNAADSRYIGFISKSRIKGRIIYSYWGRTATKRMNINFTDK